MITRLDKISMFFLRITVQHGVRLPIIGKDGKKVWKELMDMAADSLGL
jgi:hypothetical protein